MILLLAHHGRAGDRQRVISRYVFNSFVLLGRGGHALHDDLGRLLGAGPALRVGGHIAIDTLHVAAARRRGALLRGVIVAIVAATSWSCWCGWASNTPEFAWEQESPVLGLVAGQGLPGLAGGRRGLMLVHLLLISRRWMVWGEWDRIEGFDPQAL